MKKEHILWQRVAGKDDRRAFERLYLAHWERLYIIARNRTQDQDIAKDLVQEVFIKMWEKRKQIHITGTVSAYMLGVLKFQMIDYFNSEQLRRETLEHGARTVTGMTDRSNVGLSHEEAEAILDEELAEMPRNMRKSFVMKMDRHSIRDIAGTLELADQTVSNLLTEASHRLKKNLPHRLGNYPTLLLACVSGLFTIS